MRMTFFTGATLLAAALTVLVVAQRSHVLDWLEPAGSGPVEEQSPLAPLGAAEEELWEDGEPTAQQWLDALDRVLARRRAEARAQWVAEQLEALECGHRGTWTEFTSEGERWEEPTPSGYYRAEVWESSIGGSYG